MANIHTIFLITLYYSAAQLLEANIDDDALRICTEVDDFEWNGETYLGGGRVINISAFPSSKNPTNKRLRMTISKVPDEAKRLYAKDAGIVPFSIRVLVSRDGGDTYTAIPAGLNGRLGAPVFRGAEVEVPLESRDADIGLASPATWSDEGQRARHPNDKGFEYTRALAQAFESGWV